MDEFYKESEDEKQERLRKKEHDDREIAKTIVSVVTPNMTIGELANLLFVRLEQIARVLVSRVNTRQFPPTLKDHLGRGVDYEGKVTDDFGRYK